MSASRLRTVAVVLVALALGILGCGTSTHAGPADVTCDEYAQTGLLPAKSGDPDRAALIMNLFDQRNMPWSIEMLNAAQNEVDAFCGPPSPNGDPSAKRNNSSSISQGIDWESLKQN